MKISRSNYEIYFLDYLDGTLPANRVDEFLDFLKNNPDLADELKGVSNINLYPGDQVFFCKKNELLKDPRIESADFDYRTVAYLEGDLEPPEQQRLLEEVADDPAKQKSFDLMMRLRLQVDETTRFPDKKSLMRSNRKKILLIWAGSAAAILLLILSIRVFLPNSLLAPTAHQQVAVVEMPVETDSPKSPTVEEEVKSETQEDLAKLEDVVLHEKKSVPVEQKQGEFLAENKLAANDRETAPELLAPLDARLRMTENTSAITKLEIEQKPKPEIEALSLDEYLAHKLIQAPKGESFTFSNLAKAGIQAAENISNNRLSVETNTQGRISEISFQSRLIAFSIPVRKNR
ncbi:hypothetical protein [Gaoshiqia sediminis]|uniref:Uncharacterized protein n=1 Tax=Gaoshiqia sediminis TaxID=2986998 RepID=A0AA42C9P7_9BACT|nr:hypothetical protein [Gaoshiqia sediminis]MCW0482420.1 hypothetical protein [Gaoshiqia sediminis]